MINFDKEKHQYSNGNKNLISVTQLMQKIGLSPDYAFVDLDLLEKKAERGTLIHSEIEDYIKNGEVGFTIELTNFRKYIFLNQIEVIKSEQIVFNDVVAGTLDLYLKKDNTFIIADIKTTASLNKEAVSWQLSLYLYLLVNQTKGTQKDYESHLGQAFHFDGDGNLRVVDIALKPYEEIEKIMDCVRNGTTYQLPTIVIPEEQVAIIQQATTIIENAKKEQKEAEERLNSVKEALIKAMEDHGVKSYENEYFKISYVAPIEKTIIDSARLKKEQPDIAEQYSKSSTQKASVRITLKEDN